MLIIYIYIYKFSPQLITYVFGLFFDFCIVRTFQWIFMHFHGCSWLIEVRSLHWRHHSWGGQRVAVKARRVASMSYSAVYHLQHDSYISGYEVSSLSFCEFLHMFGSWQHLMDNLRDSDTIWPSFSSSRKLQLLF